MNTSRVSRSYRSLRLPTYSKEHGTFPALLGGEHLTWAVFMKSLLSLLRFFLFVLLSLNTMSIITLSFSLVARADHAEIGTESEALNDNKRRRPVLRLPSAECSGWAYITLTPQETANRVVYCGERHINCPARCPVVRSQVYYGFFPYCYCGPDYDALRREQNDRHWDTHMMGRPRDR